MGEKLEIYQNDSEIYTGTVTSDGEPVLLSGASITFSVKENIDSSGYLIQKKSDDISEIDIFAPSSGNFYIYLNPEDTELEPGFYPYDIEIILASGFKKTIEMDFLEIKKDVT
ncbi:MAG: hypothetical protein WC476_01130 [Phycisphaerae bacterium]|jgi:hypothetical protein